MKLASQSTISDRCPIEDAHASACDRWLQRQGVVSIGMGKKRRNGKLENEMGIVVFVKQKIAAHMLGEEEKLPTAWLGWPVDVEQIGEVALISDFIKGGTKIFSSKLGDGGGTLGCLAYKLDAAGQKTKEIVLLSCAHVISDDIYRYNLGIHVGIIEKSIIPPCAAFECCRSYDAIVTHEIPNKSLCDAAAATLAVGKKWVAEVETIGEVRGTRVITAEEMSGVAIKVQKYGITTAHTHGFVRCVGITTSATGTCSSEGNSVEITAAKANAYRSKGSVMLIESDDSSKFADYGDSGSIVFDEANLAIGMVYAIEKKDGGRYALVDSIDYIEQALGVKVATVTDTGGLTQTVESTGTVHAEPCTDEAYEAASSLAEGVTDALRGGMIMRFTAFSSSDSTTRQAMLQHPLGAAFLEIFDPYLREIVLLVNKNRETMVAWRRHKGPLFLGYLIKYLDDAAKPIPKDLNREALQKLLGALSLALKRNGSTVLRAKIEAEWPRLEADMLQSSLWQGSSETQSIVA
jgi:hypothetical protein